jgi:tetratricopeptide (TPR) repeat protein
VEKRNFTLSATLTAEAGEQFGLLPAFRRLPAAFTFSLALTQYLLIFRWPALLVLLLGLGVAGCASDKNLVAHSFNNLAARDNAYFLAREKLRAAETKLYDTRQNDYNQVLPLFPTLDSAAVRANRTELNDIIKKASMPIQHRPGSDWTDDAYLLVAWSRFYQMQFDDAALTFKYVNSTSKDANAKHEALIGLMRTFVALKEFDNAKAVSDLLDKESGLEKDARELFLTRADYYIRIGEPQKAIPQLEKAIPLIEFKNERSRTRYVLAQLYQDAGENKKAYDQLNQILARNPPYELDFFAKLMLGQVSDLNQQDRARLDKYFANLLKDPKNKDYRDKIYYEMARLNYREQKYPEALTLLRQSIKATTINKSQKSYTYLLAGRIYYENLQKYPLAAAYYDSTVQNMTKESANYAAIKERSDILKDFAKQYTIIETQDSLQTLARLDKDALDKQLDLYADAEIAAKKAAAAKLAAAQKAKEQAEEFASRKGSDASSTLTGGKPGADPSAFDPMATAGAKWYFDNPATLGTARADFLRKWGNRKLQDNWRTSSQSGNAPNNAVTGGTPLAGSDKGSLRATPAGKSDSTATAKEADPAAEKQALIAAYRKNLPLTPDQLATSDTQVEAAMYELGGIYKEQLKEKEKGIATYEKEVTRYVRGQHAPDAYYLLYLYYKDKPDAAKMDEYAAALQKEFPNSIYAKLIADPLYREHEQALHKAVAARLDSAFTYYKDQEFKKAGRVLARTEKQFPKHDLTDRVAYLKTLLIIRTQPPLTARTSVEKFYKDYPNSPLVPLAQALASTYKKQESGQIAGALASTDKPVISMFRPGEVDNRMRIFYSENETPATKLPTPEPTKEVPKTMDAPKPVEAPKEAAPNGSAGPAPAALGTAPRNGLEPAAPPTDTPETGASGLTPTPTPAPATGATTASSTPAAPTTAYTTQLSAAHAVVLVFPKATPASPDLATQLATYNTRFFRANNLQVQPQPLGATQDLLVVRALPGAKVAQSYATKLRGPQSPLAKLRGQGYQALVISLENLTLLQTTGDLAGYLSFYQSVYK